MFPDVTPPTHGLDCLEEFKQKQDTIKASGASRYIRYILKGSMYVRFTDLTSSTVREIWHAVIAERDSC